MSNSTSSLVAELGGVNSVMPGYTKVDGRSVSREEQKRTLSIQSHPFNDRQIERP